MPMRRGTRSPPGPGARPMWPGSACSGTCSNSPRPAGERRGAGRRGGGGGGGGGGGRGGGGGGAAAAAGSPPGAPRRNLDWVLPHTDPGTTGQDELLLLADAQTSGGLLVAGEVPGAPVI